MPLGGLFLERTCSKEKVYIIALRSLSCAVKVEEVALMLSYTGASKTCAQGIKRGLGKIVLYSFIHIF